MKNIQLVSEQVVLLAGQSQSKKNFYMPDKKFQG